MRKFIVITMTTLDGVIQAPGGPEEDPSGGFGFGGWVAPHEDEVGNKFLQKLMQQTDYLLGRKTFEIWESYWPTHAEVWPGINEGTKYVLSNTRTTTDWKNTVFLESVDDLEKLKNSEGSDVQVWGSSQVVQLLLHHDLVDELHLLMYPLVLGEGKRWFDGGSFPSAFTLVESMVTSRGVIMATYARAGEVKTGTVSAE